MLRTESNEPMGSRYREAGEWLREQRRHWQITRAELAEQAGLGDAAIVAAIEDGEIALPRSALAAVALTFGIDRDRLADRLDNGYGAARAAA